MTTPAPTPTPAQMLELFAQNIEAHHQKERARAALSVAYPDSAPFDDEAFVQARESFYRASDHAVHISQQALALDPATLRAQAAALASKEAECERLRVALEALTKKWEDEEPTGASVVADELKETVHRATNQSLPIRDAE